MTDTEIKDCKMVLEEATNSLLTSETAIVAVRDKLEHNKKLTPDENDLVMAIIDCELTRITGLKASLIKLYRPFKEE